RSLQSDLSWIFPGSHPGGADVRPSGGNQVRSEHRRDRARGGRDAEVLRPGQGEAAAAGGEAGAAVLNPRIETLEVVPVKVTPRGDWIFVGLGTPEGFIGWGEASHGFGFRQASDEANEKMRTELERLFERLRGRSPF